MDGYSNLFEFVLKIIEHKISAAAQIFPLLTNVLINCCQNVQGVLVQGGSAPDLCR